MFYYLYRITNLVNKKIYVGVHKTSNMEDGYMGSGKVIKSAIQKYGIDNFKKDILETFESSGAMYAKEKEVVTDDFLLREDVYNLRRGGTGGFDYLNKTKLNLTGHHKSYEARVNTCRKNHKKILESGHRISDYQIPGFKSEENKRKMHENAQSEQARLKRKKTMQINNHNQGDKNSQFGTVWITDGNRNLKIKKGDTLPEGYRLGRLINIR